MSTIREGIIKISNKHRYKIATHPNEHTSILHKQGTNGTDD